MKYNPVFNPLCDLQSVAPGLSIDLAEAIETGVVKSTGTVDSHNGIEDTEDIIGRVYDNFDAMEAMNGYVKASNKPSVSTSEDGEAD